MAKGLLQLESDVTGLSEARWYESWTPNNCQTVLCFIHNSVLNGKYYNRQPSNKRFVQTTLCELVAGGLCRNEPLVLAKVAILTKAWNKKALNRPV